MVKSKEKACKLCKAVYESEDKCPKCGSKEFSESFKGKIIVTGSESEIAKNLNITEKGVFAIKTR